VIRDALAESPGLRTADLVEALNDHTDRLDDKLSFSEGDVLAVRKTMKKSRQAPTISPATPEAVPEPPAPVEVAPPKQTKPRRIESETSATSPVDLIDKVFDLAKECGGIDQLKRLVDRIAEIRRR
jgi:hypothetical protein